MIKYKVWKDDLSIDYVGNVLRETEKKIVCGYLEPVGWRTEVEVSEIEYKETKKWIYFNTKAEATQYVLSVAMDKQVFYNKVIEDNSPSYDYKYTRHDADVAKLIYFQEVVVTSIVKLCEKRMQILGAMKKKPKALEFYINLLDYYMPINEKLKGDTDNNSKSLHNSLTPNQMNTFSRAVFTALELIEKHGQNRVVWDKIERDNKLVHANNYVANRVSFNTGFGG